MRNEEKDEKTDTRVQFTQHKLREAILELLQEKSIDSISVKEICEKAGLNRGTFNLHYDSPNALLKDIETRFLAENDKLFRSFWQEGRERNIMAALFSYIKDNSDFFCILMGPHGGPNFVNEVFSGVRDGIIAQWQLEFPHYHREDLDFVFDYILQGSTRLILNWLQDSKGLPASLFAQRIERMGHYVLVAVKDF